MAIILMNTKLGKNAYAEIRDVMRDKSGKFAKSEAVRLAEKHSVNWRRIYEITEDLRPKRKPRTDKGNRQFQIVEGSDLWKAFELVVEDKLDPDQALATAALRGHKNLPTLAQFQRLLTEKGLDRKARRSGRRAYRKWEANSPGEIFQVDVTGLKERWMDIKTRKILKIAETEINRNHPACASLLRIWQIMLTDDCTRRRYLKYIVKDKITSDDMVEFLLGAFDVVGVPLKLYTDNGGEFLGRHKRAEKLLNTITLNEGGYEHITHKPHNAQATGKVEVAHQWAEKADRFIGLAIKEGRKPEIDVKFLNGFAEQICTHYNEARICRAIGSTPMARWFARRSVVRKLPFEIIKSALLSDEFVCTLFADCTVSHKGVSYQIPQVRPFVEFINQKISIVVPPDIEVLIVILPDGSEHEITKVIASADVAGEFKRVAESTAQQLVKRAKETRKLAVKAIKETAKTGEIAPIPYIDTVVSVPAETVLKFPKQEITYVAADVAKVAPVSMSHTLEREINKWEAFIEFIERFTDADECKIFLDGIFGDGELIAKSEIENAIDNREIPRLLLLGRRN